MHGISPFGSMMNIECGQLRTMGCTKSRPLPDRVGATIRPCPSMCGSGDIARRDGGWRMNINCGIESLRQYRRRILLDRDPLVCLFTASEDPREQPHNESCCNAT